jgi:hypothetical protein
MSLTRCVVLAAAVGCGLTAMVASAGDDKPGALDDARTKAVVAYFANNGVKLASDGRGKWMVTDPKGDGYKVIVHMLTFPAAATGPEMRDQLKSINLAYMLNAPARVAMSYPYLQGIDLGSRPPKLDQVPVVAKLEKLFKDYQPQYDPVYMQLPEAIRPVFEDTFPGYRCIRLVTRGEKDATVYRGTVFDPAAMSSSHQRIGGETVTTPNLYHLELDANGKVLEETLHFVDRERLPKAVAAAYEKWNPKGVEGREFFWQTGVPRGKDRVYLVRIIENAIKGYSASFKEDGSVLAADPAVVP